MGKESIGGGLLTANLYGIKDKETRAIIGYLWEQSTELCLLSLRWLGLGDTKEFSENFAFSLQVHREVTDNRSFLYEFVMLLQKKKTDAEVIEFLNKKKPTLLIIQCFPKKPSIKNRYDRVVGELKSIFVGYRLAIKQTRYGVVAILEL